MTCETYCSHGGACSLEVGHDGVHNASGYCTFTDAEAVSKDEADQILCDKDPVLGPMLSLFT